MKITELPFCTVDWNAVERITHAGASGHAHWRTRHFGDVRVRMADNAEPHRSSTQVGAKLYVID